MLSGKSGDKIAKFFCIGQHHVPIRRDLIFCNENKIEVGEFIHFTTDPGASDSEADYIGVLANDFG